MPIKGLRNAAQAESNTFDPADEAEAATEALSMLGLVEDREQVTESLTTDFNYLQTMAGVSGEPFVQLPRSLISLPNILSVMDGASYSNGREYPTTYVDNRLWTPGTAIGSYEPTDIGNLEVGQKDANWPAHARLAVYNPSNISEPLIHFLGQPLDGKHAKPGQETQLQALAKAQSQYETNENGLAMTALNTPGLAMIALTRRIKGQAMPLEWGFMNDATLPRTTADDISVVGTVYSVDGRLTLDRSSGNAHLAGGIGISVGSPKPLEF